MSDTAPAVGCRGLRLPCVSASFDPQLHECDACDAHQDRFIICPKPPVSGLLASKSSTWLQRDEQVRRTVPSLILAFSRPMHGCAPSLGLCLPGPQFSAMWPSHLCVTHASHSLRGRPRGWWKSSTVLMWRGCASCRACRSGLIEWARRIAKGFISVRRCVCTLASVVVTGPSAAAVFHKNRHWGKVLVRRIACKLTSR